jgi:hypothetical protein
MARFWVLIPRAQVVAVSHGTIRLGDVFGTVTKSTLDPDGVCPV